MLIKYTVQPHHILSVCAEIFQRRTCVRKGKRHDFDDRLSVLHSEMAPDLLKVRPTMNHRSLLTLEVSGVPYMLVRGDHIQTGYNRQWGHSHCPSMAVTLLYYSSTSR